MASYHTRSNSFPCKQHPLFPEFDEQSSRLRSSQETSSSSTSIASKLSGVQDLHDSLDRLISLTLNQQALSNERNEKLVCELLDGSLRVLDICNGAKDSLLQMKDSTQELQSILRRKRGGDTSLINCEVKRFLASRKSMKKAFQMAMENKCNSNKSQGTDDIVSVLREAESITLNALESLISFVSGSKQKKSFVAKLINSKRVVCEEVVNEFESAEAALKMLVSQKAKKSDNKVEENAQNELQNLEMCIQDFEEGVDSLYRRLIKTRVSLLNILNQ